MNAGSGDRVAASGRLNRVADVRTPTDDFTLLRKQQRGLDDECLIERRAALEHFVVTVPEDSHFVRACIPAWKALYRRLVPEKLLTGEWSQTSTGSEEFTRAAVPLARKLLAYFAADRAIRSSLEIRPSPDVMWACMEPFKNERAFAYALGAYLGHRGRRLVVIE